MRLAETVERIARPTIAWTSTGVWRNSACSVAHSAIHSGRAFTGKAGRLWTSKGTGSSHAGSPLGRMALMARTPSEDPDNTGRELSFSATAAPEGASYEWYRDCREYPPR